MDAEELHREVERLNFNDWKCRALIHAMIDYGKLTMLECQLPECVMDTRAFAPRIGVTAGRGQPGGKGLVFDHIQPRLQGGSDRPENLRIIHAACNNSRSKGRKDSAEVRAKKSAAATRRGGWKRAIEARPAGWNLTRMNPTTADLIKARYAAGERLDVLAGEYGVSYTTAWKAKNGHYDQYKAA